MPLARSEHNKKFYKYEDFQRFLRRRRQEQDERNVQHAIEQVGLFKKKKKYPHLQKTKNSGAHTVVANKIQKSVRFRSEENRRRQT